MKNLAFACLFGLVLLSLAQIALQLPHLPDKVATHFDGAGKPNGFASKSSHAVLMLALMMGMPLMTAGSGMLMRWLPPSLINLPHRDYWLSGERREATLREMQALMVWIAVATQVFLLCLNQLTYWANVHETGLNMLACNLMLGAFLMAIAGICLYMILKYRRVPPGWAGGTEEEADTVAREA